MRKNTFISYTEYIFTSREAADNFAKSTGATVEKIPGRNIYRITIYKEG